jgi:hypothetical protein
MNDNKLIHIQGSIAGTEEWGVDITVKRLPSKIIFRVLNGTRDRINKVYWCFGDTNKIKSPTPDLEGNVKYIYKDIIENTTLMVQTTAEIYNERIITNPINIVFNNINNNYIDDASFQQQILDFYNRPDRTIPDDIAISIQKIAERLAFSSNFINYTYLEDMKGDAIVRMIQALSSKKFDPLKGSPFNYFTTIAFNAFRNRIKKEKKTRETLLEFQSNTIEKLVCEGLIPQSALTALLENINPTKNKEDNNEEL